ncbi:DUF3099 domain-containing protein, partial [Rathayibacter sp. AY1D4]|uniref:DUF3099 domain-containing protein n=1 Tax=Rathayibacter sp. AY1D4 TaxID=2080545 RepID=UPI000CE7833B
MKSRETLTSLPPSPSAERRSRAIKYSIAMGIRMLCVICLLFAHGWWLLFFAIGAVVLPYFAVVLANVGSAGERGNVERHRVGGPVRGDQPVGRGGLVEPRDLPAR